MLTELTEQCGSYLSDYMFLSVIGLGSIMDSFSVEIK